MKCEFCAGDLSIDDARCPHCDAENRHYKKHREDMAAYNRRFEATQEAVLKKSSKIARKSIQIITICVLVLLIVISTLVLIFMGDINYEREYNKNTKNAAKIAEKLSEFEAEDEYMEMYSYKNSFIVREYRTPLSDFSHVSSILSPYSSFIFYMDMIALDEIGYLKPADLAGYINRNLDNIYQYGFERLEEKKERDPVVYSERHIKSGEDMIRDVEVLLKYYVGFTDEEINEIWTMSSAKREVLLEEKLEEIFVDEEE